MADPSTSGIPIAIAGTRRLTLDPRLANRHGLITGATGTGKTVSLQLLAEGLSRAGVPVFAADIKGDLSGIGAAGQASPRLLERTKQLGIEPPRFAACPVRLWDLEGKQGHALRTTVSELGPLLLTRLLDLTDVQAGVIAIGFKLADDRGWLLLDLKDLRAVLRYVAEHQREIAVQYGAVATSSIAAIERASLQLETEGGDVFLGEPALALGDLLALDDAGHGVVNILAADGLTTRPRLYATFLLWLISELFEQLPEVGDLDKPKLCFFFDEAHLLFNEAPKVLLDAVERVVRLIRSKGVGIYFVTQNPLDVPEMVLAQLGNRVQHALRAFTPRDQRAVRAAAETFRPNPKIDTAAAITELGVGEALVSVLDAKGVPTPVERGFILPPSGRIGPLKPDERTAIIAASPLGAQYDTPVDRTSAFEVLDGGAAADRRAPREGTLEHLDQVLTGSPTRGPVWTNRTGPGTPPPVPEPAPQPAPQPRGAAAKPKPVPRGRGRQSGGEGTGKSGGGSVRSEDG